MKYIFSLFIFMIGISGLAQNILISQGGTVNVSGGEVFYDAGGPAGNDGNTSYTITLSPATAGEAVCVDFTSFISNGNLEIFDGPNTASRNIGTLRGDYSLNYNAGGTPYRTGQTGTPGVPDVLSPGVFCSNNASGVLTFRYTGPSGYAGWVGQVITYKQASAGCTVGLTASPSTICVGGSSLLSATGVLGVPLMSNDFNTSTVGTGWSSTASVSFQSVLTCEPNYGYATSNTDNSIFVWMQNAAAPRTLETTSYDVSGGGYLSFDFREASDDNGGNGCEALDDNEGVYVQYSTDGGTSWNNLKLMFPSVESNFPSAANIGCGTYVYDWNTTTVPLPAAALSANTKFRWTQRQSTSATQDSWGLDNVRITRYATATLTITDLSTNTVIATTTTPSTSISVSPAVTTTYRATLTDGVTTCTQDITVTVNGGTATTINYAGSPFLPNAGASNVTVTNGPVSGSYSATPAGLTINTTTGQVTPSTSTPGTYTVSVPTSCGTATTTVEILSSTCGTCALATCPVISITATSAALGQTNISTALGTAGDQLGTAALVPGENITICVPVTVVAGSTILGFKQLTSSSPGGCGTPSEQVITYQLTDAACGATISPNRTNASSVASGFNPEWDGLAPGNYVLCFTMNVTNTSLCSSVDIQGLGYYNVIPPPVPCQDYQIQMYSDDLLLNPITKTAFACSDASVFLGPDSFSTTFDSGLPYNSVNISITANAGNLNNLVIYRYNSANVLVETLTVPAGGVTNNYFLRPTGAYYSLDKTNLTSGNYSYTITDNTSGAVLATGTWIITAGAESLKTGLLLFQGTGNYSGPGVTNGFDPAPAGSVGDDYTDDRGIGVFNPQAAGVGTHTITYTWDNGLPAPNHCTLTRTMVVTVTGPSAPTASNVSICSGQTATLTATAVTGTVNWYTAATGGSSVFTGNPFTTPTLTAATSYWVSQTIGGCESARTKVDVSISAGTPATYTSTLVNCAPGSINLSAILPTGTTFNWVSGPSGYTFPAGYQTPLTTNTSLTGLPAGTYCVDVTSPNSLGGVVTQTLFTETFEAGLANWTINNSGGPNIFVLNNDYLGGSCVTGLGTFTVPAVPNQPVGVTSGPNSNYLHIKATTTTGATCGAGSVNFIPNNANFDGQVSDQKATINTVFNTIGKTNVVFNFYWLAQGETNANGADDFGSIEYSINGGTSWVQAGAKLRRQTTWLSDFRSDPLWDNQADLRFRVRWQNDASSSIDPPISIDEIIITADVITTASCGTTVQECFTILPTPVVPTITSVAATCLAAGSSSISNYNASNTYTFTPAGPTVGAGGLVSGMTVGTSYTVTATNGGCTSSASASFSNAAQLPTPAVPTITSVAATCLAAGTSTISNYSASNTYTFTPAGPTVGAGGLVSGMTVGTSYTVTATNGGCTSSASASFSNAAQLPTPAVPTITSVAADCSSAGTSTISNYNASNTYTFTPAGPTVGATGLISGMTVGTSYTVTATNGGCTSTASASFSNAAQLPTPAVPTITSVAATCSSAGSSTISNYNASNTYTFTPAGPIVGAGGLVSGMTVGTSYTVTATNGGCTSLASASFSNAAQLPTPAVPTITSTPADCSSAGSSTISNYNATNTYTFTPAGPTVGATGLVSGMTVGTSYTVTATNGGCTSTASASFSNAAQLPTPAVPTITSVAATCSSAGSSSISNYNASNTYTFTPAGPTVGAAGLVSGMTVGTSYTVTATNGGCTSTASASFSNAAQLPTPAVPTITSVAATCSAAGSSTISNYNASNTYTFTPAGPTVGATGLVSGMTVGTSYTVTATNGGCTSTASASFSNAAQLPTPAVPTITSVAATCLAAGSSTISNYNASNTYTFTPAGPTVGAGGLVSGMTVGTSYTVTATNGGCTSTA
ncbi:Ig-like domain-containing protein, partial [Flavobacterium sp.]